MIDPSVKTNRTRRAFLRAGAALAAATVAAAAAARDSEAGDRLALSERFRELIRQLNSGQVAAGSLHLDESIRSVVIDAAGPAGKVDFAPDHRSATVRAHCTVLAEAPIPAGCPVVEAALPEEEGVMRWTERGVLEAQCVKEGGVWSIRSLRFLADAAAR